MLNVRSTGIWNCQYKGKVTPLYTAKHSYTQGTYLSRESFLGMSGVYGMQCNAARLVSSVREKLEFYRALLAMAEFRFADKWPSAKRRAGSARTSWIPWRAKCGVKFVLQRCWSLILKPGLCDFHGLRIMVSLTVLHRNGKWLSLLHEMDH